MNSTLNASTAALLRTLGFDFIKADARTHHEHWLSQEDLPHIHILIDPAEKPRVSDLVRAIHSAGASDQRDRTRSAFNRLADTFRNGQPVASPDDILSLSESS